MNIFPDIKSPNFDPKHEFLSSIEAEFISFLLKKAVIFIFANFGCFMCPVTMFDIIVFMLIPFRAIFQQNGSHIEFSFTTTGLDFHIWIPLPL